MSQSYYPGQWETDPASRISKLESELAKENAGECLANVIKLQERVTELESQLATTRLGWEQCLQKLQESVSRNTELESENAKLRTSLVNEHGTHNAVVLRRDAELSRIREQRDRAVAACRLAYYDRQRDQGDRNAIKACQAVIVDCEANP